MQKVIFYIETQEDSDTSISTWNGEDWVSLHRVKPITLYKDSNGILYPSEEIYKEAQKEWPKGFLKRAELGRKFMKEK